MNEIEQLKARVTQLEKHVAHFMLVHALRQIPQREWQEAAEDAMEEAARRDAEDKEALKSN